MIVTTYTCLLTSVILALFSKNIKIITCIILLSHIAAFFANIITSTGIIIVIGFWIIVRLYFRNPNRIKWINRSLFSLVFIYATLISLHKLPGFNNLLILDKIYLSPLSSAFSMYLNFDKVVVALILYVNSSLLEREKFIDIISIKQLTKILTICLLIVIPSAIASRCLMLDIKISEHLMIWAVNNLFFVCFAEEVFFRGILQNHLISFCSNHNLGAITPILVSALFFGFAHISGGIFYIIFATICGGFYGYAYHKTGRIFISMLIHFMLNLCHFIFFSYPAPV
jgi:membrane protease YdiL (CAAX protease family)